MPILATIDKCVGCGACCNVCAKHAIRMQEDTEGYMQPVIEAGICVDCGLCEKSCPVITPVKRGIEEPNAYAMWHNADRTVSSSGGAFSAFARFVLKKGGLVFGAAYDEGLKLHHIAVDNVEGLDKLRGSKYMQSVIGTAYQNVKTALNRNKWVLFCGTPCQVAGLKSYLRKDYDTLITLDLACHGVPSNKIFQAYLEKLKNRLDKAENTVIWNYEFRRRDGWGKSPSISTAMNSYQRLYGVDALYMEAFNASAIFRKCCYSCSYAEVPRVGDCTIADFWGLGRYGIPFKHDVMKGVSLVLANNKKGEKLLSEMDDIFLEKRTLKEALIENPNLRQASPYNEKRETLIEAFLDPTRDLDSIDKEFNLVDHSIKNTIKNWADKMGLFDIVKRVYNWCKAR